MCFTELRKVKVINDQEMAQSERNSHSKNRVGKKTKLAIRKHLYLTILPCILPAKPPATRSNGITNSSTGQGSAATANGGMVVISVVN